MFYSFIRHSSRSAKQEKLSWCLSTSNSMIYDINKLFYLKFETHSLAWFTIATRGRSRHKHVRIFKCHRTVFFFLLFIISFRYRKQYNRHFTPPPIYYPSDLIYNCYNSAVSIPYCFQWSFTQRLAQYPEPRWHLINIFWQNNDPGGVSMISHLPKSETRSVKLNLKIALLTKWCYIRAMMQ